MRFNEYSDCPACGEFMFITNRAECVSLDCDYTTAGLAEHDPEPNPEPCEIRGRTAAGYGNLAVEKWADQAAIDQRNLEIAEARVKPEQSCSDCGGGMARRRIRGTKMSVPFCERCQCPTKPERTCPQCNVGRLHTSGYIAGQAVCFECGFRAMGLGESQQIALEREQSAAEERVLRGFTSGLMPDKGAAIEKLNRELLACDEMDRVRPGLHVPRRNGKAAADAAHEVRSAILSHGGDGKWTAVWIDELATPNPEAEVTELERLRCLVKTLEQEAQGLRGDSGFHEMRAGMAANEAQRLRDQIAVLRMEKESDEAERDYAREQLAAEKSAHLDARLALVKATAELKALRESYAECVEAEADGSEQMQRSASDHYGGAKSRLADVPSFEFHRGQRITCSEED